MNFLLPYGKQGMEVCLPDKNAHILTPPDLQDLSAGDATLAKLESPLGSPPFEEMAEGEKTALIAMADHHRFGTYQKEILNQCWVIFITLISARSGFWLLEGLIPQPLERSGRRCTEGRL